MHLNINIYIYIFRIYNFGAHEAAAQLHLAVRQPFPSSTSPVGDNRYLTRLTGQAVEQSNDKKKLSS